MRQTEPTDAEVIYWIAAKIFASRVVANILIKDLRLTPGNGNETCMIQNEVYQHQWIGTTQRVLVQKKKTKEARERNSTMWKKKCKENPEIKSRKKPCQKQKLKTGKCENAEQMRELSAKQMLLQNDQCDFNLPGLKYHFRQQREMNHSNSWNIGSHSDKETQIN